MIFSYSEVPYNTNRECYDIEDIIIKTALNDGAYNDLIKECKNKGIKLQYDDVHRTKANLVRRTTGKTWSKIKEEIVQKSKDYSGIVPTKNGYEYKGKIYSNLEEAHYLKLKKQYPKLARIIYE